MTMRENYGFRRRRELQDHFANHEDDENHRFGDVDEYGGMAEAFLDLGQADDVDEYAQIGHRCSLPSGHSGIHYVNLN